MKRDADTGLILPVENPGAKTTALLRNLTQLSIAEIRQRALQGRPITGFPCTDEYGAEDEEILSFYRQIRKALDGKEYRIVYLKAKDIRGNLEVIRKERSDEQGNEVWFPMMMGFFNDCPYAKTHKLKGEEDLIRHFIHRQEMELRICKEIFPDKSVIIESKNYSEKDITFCG